MSKRPFWWLPHPKAQQQIDEVRQLVDNLKVSRNFSWACIVEPRSYDPHFRYTEQILDLKQKLDKCENRRRYSEYMSNWDMFASVKSMMEI
jgi:hypothetical protein